jgi:signal transduction histidine kinase
MIVDEIVERITGRWAFSFKAWLYLTILGILGTKSRTYALLDITQLESVLLAISVHLINAPLYYFFAQKLFKKRFTEPLSLMSVLGTFLLFMLTISTSEILITIYVFDQTAYLGPQLFAPLFPSLFGFIASCYLLAEFDQNRKDIKRLAFAKSTLEKTAHESQDQIVAERSQLISAIQDSVFYQLDALKKQFSLLGSNPRRSEIERLANELEEYSANTIRSLSHEIAEDVGMKSPIDRLSFVGSLNSKKSMNNYQPYISFKFAILGMILIGGNHEASLSGYKGFLLQLAAALILSPILFVGKIATRKYSPNNLYIGFASYLLTIFLSGYILTALVSSEFIKNLEIRNEYSPIVYSARTLSGIIVASLIVTIVEARRNTLNNLVAMNEKLQVEIDWMDNRSSELRKELASILHGPLQGRIAGIAMALRLNAEEEDLSDDEKSKKLEDIERLLQTVIHDVQELFKVEKNQPEASIIIKLIKLRRSWEGIAKVKWTIEPHVFAVLGASYFKTISEILYEAVSNSVRHGGATAVSIAINADANNLILEIADDGKGVNQLPIPGAGFRKFSEFGATYSFDLNVKQGAKMTVLLPIIS